MKALVFVELRDAAPTPDSLGLLAALHARGAQVCAVLCGSSVPESAVAAVAAHCPGTAFLADAPVFRSPTAAPRADVIAALVQAHGFELLAFATSVLTTELAATLSARLEAGLVWNLVDVRLAQGQATGIRSSHGDAMRAEVEWTGPVRIALFRPRCFAPGPVLAKGGALSPVPVAEDAAPGALAITPAESGQAVGAGSLASAQTIVSGGRGIGKTENLALIEDLAGALGGQLGVSLPLVDMGWAPRALQVGQTGTVVAPRLYVACGISGQIQHKLGMERSEYVVAINKDRDAPIMGFCDLGIVGDLVDIVPRLAEALRARA